MTKIRELLVISLGITTTDVEHKIIGFKEIRHFRPDELDWFKRAFPKAKFVINWRKDREAQLNSAFYEKNNKEEEAILHKENQLIDWGKLQVSKGGVSVARRFAPFVALSLTAATTTTTTTTTTTGRENGLQDPAGRFYGGEVQPADNLAGLRGVQL